MGEASLPNGRAIVTLTRVQNGDPLALSDEAFLRMKDDLKILNDRVSLNSFFVAAQSEIGVEHD